MSHPSDDRDAIPALAALRHARAPDATARRIVDAALAERPRRRTPWLVGGFAVAAAAAGLTLMVTRPAPPSADRVEVGAHTVTRAPDADVEVVRRRADDTLIRLEKGSAKFTVAPLAAGESFRVRTAEIEVEVVGTAFAVTTADGCSTVEVSEGRVRVSAGHASSLLGAGERLEHCATATETAMPGEQTMLEAQRLMLEPDGGRRAAELFAGYLKRHPDGVFVEEARFHLAFALRAAGDEAAAVAAAAAFLERFPESRRAGRMSDAFPTAGR